MAFGIPDPTRPSQSAATQCANRLDQLVPPDRDISGRPQHAALPLMAPDDIKRSDAPSSVAYDAGVLHRAAAGAGAIAGSAIAATEGAAERVGPALVQLGSTIAGAAVGVARAALPIAAETLGAGALVIATQSPAGERESDVTKTRAIDAARHQRLESIAYPDAAKAQNTTFPGQRIDVGLHHTTLPAYLRAAKEGIHTTPAETQAEPVHTGHALPNLCERTKPTGTTIDQPTAADQAMLAKQEKIVKPEHTAHLTSSGTLVNADKAVIDVERKINGYSLNPQHTKGTHKARVFKSALGYDTQNSQGLVDQIRAGVQTQSAVPGKINEFGTQFGVDIPVTGPGGSATVRTGWNYDPGSDVPRLTTAVVK